MYTLTLFLAILKSTADGVNGTRNIYLDKDRRIGLLSILPNIKIPQAVIQLFLDRQRATVHLVGRGRKTQLAPDLTTI